MKVRACPSRRSSVCMLTLRLVQVFGMEAGVGAALFVLIIPALQIFGGRLRERFSVKH